MSAEPLLLVKYLFVSHLLMAPGPLGSLLYVRGMHLRGFLVWGLVNHGAAWAVSSVPMVDLRRGLV